MLDVRTGKTVSLLDLVEPTSLARAISAGDFVVHAAPNGGEGTTARDALRFLAGQRAAATGGIAPGFAFLDYDPEGDRVAVRVGFHDDSCVLCRARRT